MLHAGRLYGQADYMVVTTQPGGTVAGHPVTGYPAVTLYDESDNPADAGIEVTVTLNMNEFTGESTVSVSTGEDGVATFDNLVIESDGEGYRLTFSSAGLEDEISDSFDVVEEIAVITVDRQPVKTIAGELINGPPSVLVTGVTTGDPLPSVNVYVSASKEDFTAGSTTMATTSSLGIATFDNLIIETAGDDYHLIFSTRSSGIADITSGPFDVVPVTGEMNIDVQPQETVEGYPVTGPPAVLLLGLDDLPVEGVDITAVININSFTPESTVTVTTGDQGMAVFDNLVIDQPGDNYRITFSVDVAEGIPNVTSNLFSEKTEVAVITIEEQPQITIAGEQINGPPTVKLETTGGIPVQGGVIYVTLNKSGFNPGSTTSAITNAGGIAVFDNLIVDNADTDYLLTFSTASSGVADKNSDTFEVAEPAGIMTISQQPLETVNGHPVAGWPAVTFTEPNGDPWEGDEITVTVTINKNDFSSGTLVKETTGGTAVFDDLVLNATGNDYILSFNVDIAERIAGKDSDPFSVSAVAGVLDITLQPSEAVAGDPINGPPTVRLTNLLGNPVPDVVISVTLNKSSFSGSSTLTATTSAQGYAAFANLAIDDHDTGYRLTFSAGASGVADVTSVDFEITDASLTMEVTTQPQETVAGNTITGPPSVTITNGGGGIEGVVVTASLNINAFATGSTLTATTNASGMVVFDNLIINTAGIGYQITFNAALSGVPNAKSDAFIITSAAPSYILVTVQPQNTVAGNMISGPPEATLFDTFGNRIAGHTITVEANQNDFAAGTAAVETDEQGAAVFGDLVINLAATDYQLFFTAAGATTGNSNSFAITNAAPDHITIITQPSETVAGAAISGPPAVKVEDEFGNPVHGETVTLDEAGGYSFDGGTLSLETSSIGEAVFSDLVISTVGTGYQLRFSAGTLEQLSNSFNVVPGTIFSRFHGSSHSGFISFEGNDVHLGQIPARIEVLMQPGETVVGSEIEGPPRIAVYDQFDNTIPGITVTVSGAVFSAGTLTLPANEDGEISFDGLVIDTKGTYTLTFTADDYPSITANSVPFDVIDALATMNIITQPQQTIAGQPLAGYPELSLTNTIGMPLSGIDISVFINQHGFSSGTVTVTTDGNGRAVFDDLVLNTATSGYQLIFDAAYSGVQNISSDPFNVVNASAQSMNILTQPSETLQGSTIAGPPAVIVYDEFGNPVPGVAVTVTEVIAGIINSGITTISTNEAGIARFSTLIINNTGTYKLSFSSAGIPDIESGTFQVVPGTVFNRFKGGSHSGFNTLEAAGRKLGQTPVRITIVSQPMETVAGFVIEGEPRIIVYDEIDNPVAGIQVTVTAITGNFSYGNTTRITNEDGEITFGDLVIDEVGTYRLSFRADNNTGTVDDAVSVEFDVTGRNYIMEIILQPENSIAGEAIEGPPVISIANFIYQPLAGVEVTVHINQHGFASGTTTLVTDEFGEAVFDDLVINMAAVNYQLIFNADYPGISNVNSNMFDVGNAPASNISITTQPGTTLEGAAINGPPAIMLMDEFGNPVPGATITVEETGGYTFDAGTTGRITNASGIANFDDLVINAHGQYSLTFSSTGVDDAVSVNFIVLSGTVANRFLGSSHSGFDSEVFPGNYLGQTPSRIEILTHPAETVVNNEVEGPPRIIVYDEVDNPMANVAVTVTSTSGFSGSSTVSLSTGEYGEIIFDNLIIEITGTWQLTFKADEYPGITARSIEFDVVNQQLFMAVITQPGESVAGETLAGPPAVRITNSVNQGFEGVPVTVYLNQHSFASGPATLTVTTNASGIAEFTGLIINTAATGYQLIFDAAYSGIANVNSGLFDVIPADASNMLITVQPSDAEAGAAIGGPPAVTVTDEFGNRVPGTEISVTEAGGYGDLAGTLSQVTDQNGVAVFGNLVINDAGRYQLHFNAAGIGDVTSVFFNILSTTARARFHGGSHSGFISELTEDQILMDESCSAVLSLIPGFEILCEGDEFQIQVEFTGEAPFTFKYTDGDETYIEEGIVMNPYVITRNAVWQGPDPEKTYIYLIIEAEDNRGCRVAGSGGADIRVYKIPQTGPALHIPNTFGN